MRFIIALFLAATVCQAFPPHVEADYLSPAQRGVALPRGYGEVGLGYRSNWGNFAFDLDGSRLTGERLVPFRSYRDQSLVLSAGYGMTDDWEVRVEIPWVWRSFSIDRRPLVDTEGRLVYNYPDSRTNGPGDVRFATIVRPWDFLGFKLDYKTASGPDNFYPTRLPDARPARYIGSGQTNLALSIVADIIGEDWRIAGELGYRHRFTGISNYLLRDYKPDNELLAGASAYLQAFSMGKFGGGLGMELAYMHEAKANSVSVLDLGVPVWLTYGEWELRLRGGLPLYGKDYPSLFPQQLAEPRPLLGPSAEAMLVYRWRDR